MVVLGAIMGIAITLAIGHTALHAGLDEIGEATAATSDDLACFI
jgi:hypothetical protein